jgi:prokaryotic ubiquitin-like protein Pup
MAERELKKKSTPAREEQEVVEEAPATSEQGEKIKAELDDLLDEIDDVLESNAEDFVKSYVQKGGQWRRLSLSAIVFYPVSRL